MASPQESITTVNGRRCTRSRARTAATSTFITEEPAVVTPTEVTTSTAVEQAPQIQTSAAEAPPPAQDPAPQSSTAPAQQPDVAPTTEAAVTSATAVPTLSPITSAAEPSSFTAPAASAAPSLEETNPEQPSQIDTDPLPPSTDTPIAELPAQTTTAVASLPSGGSAGIIAPDTSGDDDPLTLPALGDANIGSIVGGVIGGVACLALISGLLFYCLRKRKTRAPRWNEKRNVGPAFLEKLKAVPASFGVLFAKIKGRKSGPLANPYQRHTVQTSVSSVYSTDQRRSASEPQGMFAVKRAGSVRSMSSRKSERNVLRKKQSSVSSNYRFPGLMEDGLSQNDNRDPNPFSDPGPPKTLALLNPDPSSGPITPLPAVAHDRVSKDPFASLLDQIEDAPEWLRNSGPAPGHQRTQSSTSALRSHPPSSIYPMDGNPFADPSTAPPVPTQAAQPNQKRRSSIAYPAFNATSTAASRDSQFTFFGEPGPSRPGTTMFTPAVTGGRTVRQSDPFDLDRPEVLGFGSVLGRKEVRASVTRQATRSKRTSSVGNWVNVTDGPYGPYERDSAKPGPLWSANGRR
ncbi:hypothetical protein IQ07DRAFT_591920 [Pyrenochaeta sp. DS3sAY3a]|nr:hypothetical protein IQ07DRAFT_591920 [Pyrenochaeta sp. DS3sAY3a]